MIRALLLLALAFVGCTYLPASPPPPPPPVEPPTSPPTSGEADAVALLVRVGMTEQEVRAVVGGEPSVPVRSPGEPLELRWFIGERMLFVRFDAAGKVSGKGVVPIVEVH